jgi:hypothetical protein
MHQNFDHIDHLERPLMNVRRRGGDQTAEITLPFPTAAHPAAWGGNGLGRCASNSTARSSFVGCRTPTDAYSGGVAEVVTG